MNRTKIDWADYSWNPIVGCSRGCPYCYARRINARFHYVPDFSKPQLFPDRLAQPARLRKPSWIFVCSMGELFDSQVPDGWPDQIFKAMRDAPQHTYVLLTKQIEIASAFAHSNPSILPPRFIIGMSVTSEHAWLGAHLEDLADLRIPWPSAILCVSAEPLLGTLPNLVTYLDPLGWLIVGAQTGPGAIAPDPAWITELVEAADAARVPVWTKDNLRAICPPSHWRRQKPEV